MADDTKPRKTRTPVELAFDRITAMDLDEQAALAARLCEEKPRTARFLAHELGEED